SCGSGPPHGIARRRDRSALPIPSPALASTQRRLSATSDRGCRGPSMSDLSDEPLPARAGELAVPVVLALDEPDNRPRGEDGVPRTWQPGDVVVGLDEVGGVLGEGGTGTVHKVWHRGWYQELAVRTPRSGLFDQPVAMQSFEREAQAWANLPEHPHVVSCRYVRWLGGLPRVFVEHVAGRS